MHLLKLNELKQVAGSGDWILLKNYLGTNLSMTDDVLHIMAGMALLTLGALLFRRAPWQIWPWLFTAAVEALNELHDLFQTTYPSDEGNWPSAWHDFWFTMLWPTVILLTFGWLGRRAEGQSAAVTAAIPGDEARDADVDGHRRGIA